MCAIGRGLGKEMVALITRMDQPLGCAVGNAVEVAECLDCLRGGGPDDLVSLSLELAAEMVVMAGRPARSTQARALCQQTIADGSALERFRRLVEAQGGDPRAIDDPALLAGAGAEGRLEIRREPASSARWPRGRWATRPCSWARAGLAWTAAIDPAVGVILHKKVGAAVAVDEPLCTLLVNDESRLEEAAALDPGRLHDRAQEPPSLRSRSCVERIAAAPGRATTAIDSHV